MGREVRLGLYLFLILVLLPLAGGSREPRRDPQSHRIRLMYIGDCLAIQTPTKAMELDPLISVRLVPASLQEWAVEQKDIRRYMRLYMPRTLQDLIGTTDVVMLSNSAADYFRPDWIHWIAIGTEQGMGFMMIGGYCSFGGYQYPDWGPTRVGALLPVETVPSGIRSDAFRLEPVVQDDPLLSVFDWKRGPIFFGINLVSLKPGARLMAVANPQDWPLLAYQEVGRGSALAFMSTWGTSWGDEFVKW